jgi:NADH-quinone oxidoreductase subunit L
MDHFIWLLPALPLLSAGLIAGPGRAWGRRVGRLSVAFAVLAFLSAVGLLVLALYGAPTRIHSLGPTWGSLLFDPLGVLMATLIVGISLLVRVYSLRYMVEEPGYRRFFLLLDLMTAVLLVMVTAGDLITLLVAWHLVGVLLYFLLGQDLKSAAAHRYAYWTFFTYRLGDLPLVLAAVLLFQHFGTWSLPVLFDALAAQPDATTHFGLPLADVVAGLIALAAFARSAQFLMHTWLPYTMEGPTPVSALMHAGIVNAGGFLINRFAPVFVHTGGVLHWMFIVGLVTAVVGSVLMLTQNDIKKSLGYSTMGQMGFMIMETGVGAFSLAVYHLIAHGLFKGTLFLGAGSVIGDARRHDAVPKDPLYTFFFHREPGAVRRSWLSMAAVTVAVPIVVLVAVHWLVAENFFENQGAVVLLFFGWMAGAQLLFSAYRTRSESPLRLFTLIVLSFAIVVVGYTVVSHAFDLFLYPDPAFRAGIYRAAGISLAWFDVLVALMASVIVLGWVRTYYAERTPRGGDDRPGFLWMNFYALISREFYVADLYAWVGRQILALSARLNALLRWT